MTLVIDPRNRERNPIPRRRPPPSMHRRRQLPQLSHSTPFQLSVCLNLAWPCSYPNPSTLNPDPEHKLGWELDGKDPIGPAPAVGHFGRVSASNEAIWNYICAMC